MLTLKEVRSMVSENYKGRVLTRKQLQEKEIVVKEKIDKDTEVSVYENGLVLYQSGARYSVFPLADCGDYIYEFNRSKPISAEFFENENWYMRLFLEGEDLLVRNQERLDSVHKKISYCTETFSQEELKDKTQDLLSKIIEREMCEEILSRMNARQKFAVLSYYVEGNSQKEIAERMRTTQQAVAGLIIRTVDRIRNVMKNTDGEMEAENNKKCTFGVVF